MTQRAEFGGIKGTISLKADLEDLSTQDLERFVRAGIAELLNNDHRLRAESNADQRVQSFRDYLKAAYDESA